MRTPSKLAFQVLLPLLLLPLFGPTDRAIAQETSELQNAAAGDGSIKEVTVGKFRLTLIDNSPTFSQALAINASGAVIGIRETANEKLTIFKQQSFYCDGKRSVDLPLLEGFTNLEVSALSDNGLAVGYASRPLGHPGGSLTAVVWNSKTGKLTKLEPLPGDIICQAQDISAAGTIITGYSTGAAPAKLRPCVWSFDKKLKSWKPSALPTLVEHNPYSMASQVIVSPNGRRIATCATADLTQGFVDSSLFVWQHKNGKWVRELICDDQFYCRDMNDRGVIVGAASVNGRRQPCVVDASGHFQLLELLSGDVAGEARGVGIDGRIVGFSDDPNGPTGGPQAAIWIDGKVSAVDLPGVTYSSVFAINAKNQLAGLIDIAINAGTKGEDGNEPIEKTVAFRSIEHKE